MLHKQSKEKGFTLVEVLAVITMIAILASIATISIMGMIRNSEATACETNRGQLEREYHRHLIMENVEHSDELFMNHLDDMEEVCPNDGQITYADGEVWCSIHHPYDENDE